MRDHAILAQLRSDARTSITQMSTATGIPISTIFDRIRVIEERYIHKHTTLIDFTLIGMRVYLFTRFHDRDAALSFLVRNRHVNSLYKLNHSLDFLVDCVFCGMKELFEFLDSLKEFKPLTLKEFHIIDEHKNESFLTDPSHTEDLERAD